MLLILFSKYAQVISLRHEKETTITDSSVKILDKSKRKANKIWVDKGSEFCNRSMVARFLQQINGCNQYS